MRSRFAYRGAPPSSRVPVTCRRKRDVLSFRKGWRIMNARSSCRQITGGLWIRILAANYCSGSRKATAARSMSPKPVPISSAFAQSCPGPRTQCAPTPGSKTSHLRGPKPPACDVTLESNPAFHERSYLLRLAGARPNGAGHDAGLSLFPDHILYSRHAAHRAGGDSSVLHTVDVCELYRDPLEPDALGVARNANNIGGRTMGGADRSACDSCFRGRCFQHRHSRIDRAGAHSSEG